jgi:nitrogen fixation NifU-like protein
MELSVGADGRIDDVKFTGKGCAISQASTSMLTETIKGKTLSEVATLPQEVVLENVGIGISPTRMKCAMLGLKVAKSAALGEIATWPDEPDR